MIPRYVKSLDSLRRLGQKHEYLDLLVLVIVASAMRLWGIGFDLPNLYHRDEAYYVRIPLTIIKTGDYNPHFFRYPTLFFYVLSLAYTLYFLFLASRGLLSTLDGLTLPEYVMPRVVSRATMPSQYLVGRGVVALASVLTVLLIYWIGRKAYSRRAGFVAALLLCVSPTHVRNSHFVAPDVMMILVVMASFWFSYQVWSKGRRRDYLLAGLLAGLAASTKYNAYSIVVPVIVAHLLPRDRSARTNTDLLMAILACTVGFFCGTPYAILDLPTFLNDLAFEVRHYSTLGDPGIEGQNAALWYALYLLRTEGLVPLLAVAEVVRGAIARSRKALLIASFPAVYLLLISLYMVRNDRTVLAVVPFLAILGAATLDRIITIAQRRVSTGKHTTALTRVLATVMVVSVASWPAQKAVQINALFARDDVRTQVTRWMESELPPGSRIVGEYYSPLSVDSVHRFEWIDRAIDQPITWYLANADYVVFVENRYGGFYLDPQRYPEQISSYEAMFSQFALVKEFVGGALGNPCRAMLYRVEP